MKLRHLYILILYGIMTIIANSQELLPEKKFKGIVSIDSEIELRKKQISELENLKKAILKAKHNGKKLKVGLALSGGGSKGFAHIGVLKVLEENDITIDYISGTSMGAIVASLYAVGYSPDEIETVVKTMDWKYRLSNEPMRKDIPLEEKFKSEKYFASITYDDRLNFNFPKGVLTGEKSYLKLKELFWNVQNVKSFDEFSPKLRVIATDFTTGEAKSFDHGNLAHIVSASMAIPTVYDPVRIGDNVYIDGMISRNLPVEDLFVAGADIVIASDVGAPLIDDRNYNLFTVVTKISTYRGVESTEKQRKLATIIIDPDVKLNDASNFNDFDNLILKGRDAATEKIGILKKYNIKPQNERKLYKNKFEAIYIDKIKIVNSTYLSNEIVLDNLNRNLPGTFTFRELEDLMMKIYALSYVEKAYYYIEDSTLVVEVDENDLNHIRIGINYNSDIGTKLAIGTDLTKRGGKFGIVTSAELEVGEYQSLEINNFLYYGEKNKVGINLGLGYEELPLYIYEGRKLEAESTEENKYINLNLTTKLFRQIDFSAGTRYIYTKNRYDVGPDKYEKLLGEEKLNYQEMYFKLILDRKNDIIYPTRGSYIEFKHEVGGIGSEDVEYYSEVGTIEGYLPFTSKLSISGSISGGSVSGGNIPLGRNFKIGGINTDLKDNYVSFYGYNIMRKLASEFLTGQIGIQYMVYNNVYIISKANILTYSSVEDQPILEDDSEIFDEVKLGYGVTLGYKSIVGPLEISLTNDADSPKDFIVTINMGYYF